VLSLGWQIDNKQNISIGVSCHYYLCLMPCEIKVEVVHEVDFLQVVNTTLYTTTMDFSNYFSLKNHNSHIHPCFLFFCFSQNYSLLIANVRKILNMTFTRSTPTTLLIWFIMDSSSLMEEWNTLVSPVSKQRRNAWNVYKSTEEMCQGNTLHCSSYAVTINNNWIKGFPEVVLPLKTHTTCRVLLVNP
jgi:hypothetical protein